MSIVWKPTKQSVDFAAPGVSLEALPELERRQKQAEPGQKLRRSAIITTFLLAFTIMFAQLAFTAVFAGRYLPGVTVAGLQLGGLTRSQAHDLLAHKIEGYRLNLTINGKHYDLSPQEVGAVYDINTTLDQAYLVGRDSSLAPLGLIDSLERGDLQYSYHVDQTKEKSFVNSVVTGSGKAPVDATIVIDNGTPKVEPDKNGLALDASAVTQAVDTQIGNVDSEVVVLTPSVQTARIKAADVTPAIEQTKKLLAVPVTITYQGRSFVPTPAQMSDWFVYDKSPPGEPAGLTPRVSTDGIKHYLQTVAVAININPINRKIQVQNGNSSETQAGKDGLQLDQDTLAAEIAKSVIDQKPVTVEAPTHKVPFQTEYNRTISLDYGKYIEVNLSQQHLWVYQDHNVIYESPITSGATGAGFPTVTGLFSIQAKQTNRNLNGYAIGYNYNVFVKYWMPFYGNYGLHDASWRSSFGGSDYYYGGSHGCVNLPDATAAFLFGWADVGTPVWVHN